MVINMLKAKIHRATVTDADLNYQGSITLPHSFCKIINLHEFEMVDVLNINNGARITTYVIFGPDGKICLNGAAARHFHYGDRIIVCSYCQITEEEAKHHKPKTLLLENNEIVSIDQCK